MSEISAVASVATETTTGVEGGRDVDVTVTVNGVDYDGEVTLIRDHDGEWSSWGQPDHWVSGDLLRALTALPSEEFTRALTAIARAARESCEATDS